MNKTEVKNHIIEYQNKLVANLKKAIEDLHMGADIDEEDTIDPEDFSHQTETGDMMMRLKQQLNEAETDLKIVEEIKDEKSDSVAFGALVRTEKLDFLISIPTKPFKKNGKNTVGLSANAPIYQAMLNKKAGDEFEFNGNKFKILEVK